MFNPLSANPTNCLSVFDHFVELALKGLNCKAKVNFISTAFLTIEEKSLLFHFLTRDVRLQNPLRTRYENRRIVS